MNCKRVDLHALDLFGGVRADGMIVEHAALFRGGLVSGDMYEKFEVLKLEIQDCMLLPRCFSHARLGPLSAAAEGCCRE
jgi:hypothetical protein